MWESDSKGRGRFRFGQRIPTSTLGLRLDRMSSTELEGTGDFKTKPQLEKDQCQADLSWLLES